MSRTNGRRTHVPAVAVGSVALLLAGCGGTDNPGETATSGRTETSPPGTETSMNGMETEVSLTDFRVELPEQSLMPGTYSFDVTNDGDAPHALEIEGQGIDETTTTLKAGQRETLTVDLPEGTYTFYCPVGNHRAQGMETTVTVGG